MKAAVEGLIRAVQAHLDTVARTYGYDGIATVVTYAEEPAVARFQLEGQAFRAWRSKVYGRLVDLVESGRIIAQRDGHIALVGRGDLPWIAIVKSTRDGRELYLVSFYRIASSRYLQKVEARGAVWRE